MTKIEDLSLTNNLSDTDLLVTWNGATRAIQAGDAATYFQTKISGNFQPKNTMLTNLAGLGSSGVNNQYIVITGFNTVAAVSGANLLSNIGGQPVDPTLTALAGLTTSAGDYIEATGSDTFRVRKLTVATYAALTAIPAASRHDDMLVYVASRSADGDRGEGYWRFDAGSSATANGGTILAPDAGSGRWLRQYSGAVNVLWFGAKGDDSTDNSAAFVAAITATDDVYIPEGIYRFENVSLLSGRKFTLDAGTTLKGVTTGSKLFVSSSSLIEVSFKGGEVRSCTTFIEQTGNAALAYSLFKEIKFVDVTYPFDLSTAVGNDWVECLFGVGGSADNIDVGIYFRATGTGQTNANNIVRCKFLNFATKAIWLSDTAISKIKNTISQCWFEDGTSGAILIGGASRGVVVRDCYFETNNSAEPDIEIVQSVGGTINGVFIDKNEFATAGALQTERIKNTGNSYFSASGNTVVLGSGQNFAAVNGSGTFHTELRRNYLNATGGGTYESRLFTRTGTQQVSWDTAVGSGFVTDDDQPSEFFTGRRVQNIVTFTSGDATPSVRAGNFFQTAGTTTITNFDDGVSGQQIWLRAGNTITVLGVSMVLNDVASFVNFGGTWYHQNV